MQVLHSSDHLSYKLNGLTLVKLLRSRDAIKELSAFAVLHNDVHIAVIDVAFVELNNIRMIDCPQNGELLLQKSNVLCNTLSKDRLDCVSMGWVGFACSSSHSSEMTATDHLYEVVDSSDVCCTKSL